MSRRRPSRQVIIRYSLFQIPGVILFSLALIFLQRWLGFSWWIVWSLLGLWVGKDVVLFPFVWRAYEEGNEDEAVSLTGASAVAEQRLDPVGYVRIGGELWRAELHPDALPVEAGKVVKVIEHRGMTLIVKEEQRLPS